MKKITSFLIFTCILLLSVSVFAENQPSKVVISDVPADPDSLPKAEPWTGNERADKASDYGAVAPVQVPVEYTGKAFDVVVGGVGKVLTFPFELLSRKTKPSAGGQNGKEENKKES